MSEFDPTKLLSEQSVRDFASWLVATNAKLDASETGNNVANRLVAKDSTLEGEWSIPLTGGIDIINENDLRFATQRPADIQVVTDPNNDIDRLLVAYTGIDDELRSASVDLTSALQFTPLAK